MDVKDKLLSVIEKGAPHILIGSLATRFVSLFASVFVVRILSKTDYGVLSYYDNLYSYFFLFVGYGLINSVLRYIVIADTIEEKKSIFEYCKKNGTLFNFILMTIGLFFAFFYKHPIQFIDKKYCLIMMILFLPAQYIINLNILTERAFYDNKRYASISFLYSSLLVSFKLAGAYLWALIGAVIFPLLVHFVFSFVISYADGKKYFFNVSAVSISKDKKKEINDYAIQYMITNGLWAVFTLNSTFILGRTIGDAVLLADYRIATVLPGLISIISSSYGIFVAPYFTKKESEKDYNWVKKNWKKVMFISGLTITLAVGFLFFFAPSAITIVFGNKYASAYQIMRLLLVAALFDAGVRYPTANLLASMNKVKYNMIVSCSGIFLQIVLATFLAYKYGVIGIAVSNIIVQLVMSIMINVFFVICFFKRKYVSE